MARSQLQLLKGTDPEAGLGVIPPAPASGPQVMIAQIEAAAQELTDDDLYRLATLLDQQAEERSRQEHERINHHLRTEDAYREHRRLNEGWRAAVERDEAGEADGRRYDDWISAVEQDTDPPSYSPGEVQAAEAETERDLNDPFFPYK